MACQLAAMNARFFKLGALMAWGIWRVC
jgi:hypothetical protein